VTIVDFGYSVFGYWVYFLPKTFKYII